MSLYVCVLNVPLMGVVKYGTVNTPRPPPVNYLPKPVDWFGLLVRVLHFETRRYASGGWAIRVGPLRPYLG